MNARHEPASRPGAEPDEACRSCGKALAKDEGRFLIGVGAVCVDCWDAGRRGPPPPEKPPTV
jgi:hypothetical protein